MTDDQIKHMTQRFLGWKLPEDFNPDNGISFEPEFNVEYMAKRGMPPMRRDPIGTNLFNATQAEAMVRHLVEGLDQFARHQSGRTGAGEALVPINATPAMRKAGADPGQGRARFLQTAARHQSASRARCPANSTRPQRKDHQ